jgi:hypothetical protein
MLAGTSLREKGVEGVIAAANGLVGGHLPVGLDAMLQAVELPAGVADLDACRTQSKLLAREQDSNNSVLASEPRTQGSALYRQ